MNKTVVKYLDHLPKNSYFNESALLIYDSKLKNQAICSKWIKSFRNRIEVQAGEDLKTLEKYTQILKKVQILVSKNKISSSDLTFVGFGGGTLEDFVGFLASTYQRGKKLIFVPTTWLSAIDSAHGGKNGLNLTGVKNQIGTFYPAHKVFICKSIFKELDHLQINDSFSEALKIGLISNKNLFYKLEKNFKSMWKYLPVMVAAKNKIVNKDPYEKTGLRQVLNLGHTMGHVFESYFKLSHGQAIYLGLLFTLRFSLHRGYLKWSEFQSMIDQVFLIECKLPYQQSLRIPEKEIKKLLIQDKKMKSDSKVNFIFINSSRNVIKIALKIDVILSEVKRQQKEF